MNTHTSVVEARGVDYVPEEERHGRPSSLMTMFFSINMQMTTVATGAAIAAIGGESFAWMIAAILLGCFVGTVVASLHATQGPHMGVPQLIQSRAQYGVFGASIPTAIAFLASVGLFALSGVLGGQAVGSLLHIPATAGIVIANVITLVIAWVGYDLIHAYNRYVAILFVPVFVALTVRAIMLLPGAAHPPSGFSLAAFGVSFGIVLSWQMGYAILVSDYTRYLPTNVGFARPFWYTAVGMMVGTAWLFVLGALLGIVAFSQVSNDTVGYISGLIPGITWLVLIVALLGVVSANVVNLYTGFLQFVTSLSAAGRPAPAPLLRAAVQVVVAVVGTLLALLVQSILLTTLSNVFLFSLYSLVPWTAINLVDFYVVRKGQYSIADLFKPAGIYGRFNRRVVGLYLCTMAIETPFISTPLFTGPVAVRLGGVDLSWVVGFIVAGGGYYIMCRIAPPRVASMEAASGEAGTPVTPVLG